MRHNRKDLVNEELVKLYLEEKISVPDIAKKVNAMNKTIYDRLKESKVKLRSPSEYHKLKPARYWLGKHCPNAASEGHRKAMREWWDDKNNKDKIRDRNEKIRTGMMGEDNHFYGKKHTDEVRKIIKEKRAHQITPVFDTSIELKIQGFLNIIGIEYYTHHFISEIEHKYNCDIFIPSTKTIIECDGDYFHGNPQFYKEEELREKQLKQKEFDKNRTKELLEKGYNVIRLWENKIHKMTLEDLKLILNKEKEVGV